MYPFGNAARRGCAGEHADPPLAERDDASDDRDHSFLIRAENHDNSRHVIGLEVEKQGVSVINDEVTVVPNLRRRQGIAQKVWGLICEGSGIYETTITIDGSYTTSHTWTIDENSCPVMTIKIHDRESVEFTPPFDLTDKNTEFYIKSPELVERWPRYKLWSERRSLAEDDASTVPVNEIEKGGAQELVFRAIESPVYLTDKLPKTISELFANNSIVSFDGQYFELWSQQFNMDGQFPLSIFVELKNNGQAIKLALENTTKKPLEITTGPIPPFDLLFANRGDDGFLLRNPKYEQIGSFDYDCQIGGVPYRETTTSIEPNEEMTENYEVNPTTLGKIATGRYEIAGQIEHTIVGEEAARCIEYTLTFNVDDVS